MLIEKFQEIVSQFPGNNALYTANKTITYSQLAGAANQIARALLAHRQQPPYNVSNGRVALLLEHGIDMIFALFGTLTANQVYVPLDVTYPENRMAYMLENSGADVLLTNQVNMPLAQNLVKHTSSPIHIVDIHQVFLTYSAEPVQRQVSGDRPAYILYTSGSTGRPKGVVQNHQNVYYYVKNWMQRFSIVPTDRMTLFSSFSHDGAAQDIFAALLSGACLYPYNIKTAKNTEELYTLLKKEAITIWHSVPSLYRYFCSTLTIKDYFLAVRWVLLGGEPLRAHDLDLYKRHFPQATLANVYGQTESSVTAICKITKEDHFDNVSIGEPLEHTQVFLVGENGEFVESMGVGEIVVACPHIAPGYWNNEETTAAVFSEDEDLGRLYWTGDWGRLTPEGQIMMMGRKDFQVKIRGFRVETGEIESQLMSFPGIQEAVVTIKEDVQGEPFLCAYVVTKKELSSQVLRDFLIQELPEYMIPRYFVPLTQMPMTPTGKIKRSQLPEPDEALLNKNEYEPPTNETEKKLVLIWQELLEKEKIGITDNLFELGGHSLLAISFISRVFQEFKVDLQLNDLFANPTIKALAKLIASAAVSTTSAIESAAEKPFYPATHDQFRLYVLNQQEDLQVRYNLTAAMMVVGDVDLPAFNLALQTLIQRHDVLRTSFFIQGDRLMQQIHPEVAFQIHYVPASASVPTDSQIQQLVRQFIQPFDLAQAPLLRAYLHQLQDRQYLFLLDIHHIIADGVSLGILSTEFLRLYNREELSPLKYRYIDYSESLHNRIYPQQLPKAEAYWLDVFKTAAPPLKLPYHYSQEQSQHAGSDVVLFVIPNQYKLSLNQLAKETSTTLYMVLLAIFNVFLHKYSQQEDIVVGTVLAGRDYAELENIVGFFVKTLALRNYPAPQKSFNSFLQEVKEVVINSFEYQLYPFGQLVEKLKLPKNQQRNPLFNTAFILQNASTITTQKHHTESSLQIIPLQTMENRTVMFDLQFEVAEREDHLECSFGYFTSLFKRETIELMSKRFVVLIENISGNSHALIRDIDYALAIEKEISQVEEVEFDL